MGFVWRMVYGVPHRVGLDSCVSALTILHVRDGRHGVAVSIPRGSAFATADAECARLWSSS